MKNTDARKIWLVEHPLFQYKEDVKQLARKNDLKIVDLAFKGSIAPEFLAEKTPKINKIEKA